jgi:hypothetical protein
MSNFQQIDLATVRDRAENALVRVENRLKAAKTVLGTLYFSEGAAINGHLVKKLNRALPEYKFGLNTDHGWYELEIDGAGFDTIRANLGYKSKTSVIENATINEGFKPYTLDEERLVQYREEVRTIEERAKRFNYALVELKDAYDGLGDLRFAFSDNHLPSIKDAQGRWI